MTTPYQNFRRGQVPTRRSLSSLLTGFPILGVADPEGRAAALEQPFAGAAQFSVGSDLVICLIILSFVLALGVFFYVQLAKVAGGSSPNAFFKGKGILQAIAGRFSEFEQRVADLEGQAAFQRNGFVSLLSLLEDLDTTNTIADVMNKAIDAVKAITGVGTVAIRLFDEDKRFSQLVAQSGMTPEMVAELEWLPANSGFPGEIMRTKDVICTSDLEAHPLLGGQSPIKAGMKSLASVPLIVSDDVIGSMEFGLKTSHKWSLDQKRWLMLVGRCVAVSVHQVRLRENLKKMAVLEERNRLAQEIHDGVAQLLSCIRLWAEESLILVEDNELSSLNEKLTRIESLSQEALSTLRDEMFALRTTPPAGRDLLPVFANFLNRIQKQWGIMVRLEMIRSDESQHNAFLSAAAETQLLRMVQEGLTNIRRHANAKSIVLHVEDSCKDYRVLIRDDGVGFDPQRVSPERLGLKIMQERAASVGGQAWITSEPGLGTVVEIVLPKQVVCMPCCQAESHKQHQPEIEKLGVL